MIFPKKIEIIGGGGAQGHLCPQIWYGGTCPLVPPVAPPLLGPPDKMTTRGRSGGAKNSNISSA